MTTTATAQRPEMNAQSVEQVLLGGDLEQLKPAQRVDYMLRVCESLGLNPLTKPFEFLRLNGKLVMYARKDATEQLRKINGVSIQIVARELVDDCYVVTARATDRAGRCDEAIGAVPLGSLKGEAKANAMMKAETKSKRRVTLSICGLGMLDESEVDSIPGAQRVQEDYTPPKAPAAPPVSAPSAARPDGADASGASSTTEPPHDPVTGEVLETRPATSEQVAEIGTMIGELGWTRPKASAWLKKLTGEATRDALSFDQAKLAISFLLGEQKKAAQAGEAA